jgi:hypothetical protein
VTTLERSHDLARQRPSFLKRQKEQQRHAKAAAKRARREAKKQDGDGSGQDSMMARVNEFGDIIDIGGADSADDSDDEEPGRGA